jgi:hypothetical protein
VDDVEVDGVDAEALATAPGLRLGVVARRIELRGDEDVLARDTAVAQRLADAALVA